MKTRTKRLEILVLCLVTLSALLVRIEYNRETVVPNPLVRDAKQYVIYGYNLYYHGKFSKEASADPKPDSLRSPGYPALIALAIAIGGKKAFYPVVIWSQIILSALLVPLTYVLGKRFLSSGWAFASAALVAANPHLISMTSYFLAETLFSFSLLLAIVQFYIVLEKKKLIHIVLSGVFFGFTYLVNETALFVPFLLISVLFLRSQLRQHKNINRDKLFYNIIILCIFLLFPFSWMVRNHLNVPDSSLSGSDRAIMTLSHGAYPSFMYKTQEYRYFPYREDPFQPEFSSSFKSFLTILGQRVKERPLRYLSWYFFEKPYYFWSWNILQGPGDIYVYPVLTSLYKKSKMAEFSRKIIKFFHPVFIFLSFTGLPLFFILKYGSFLFANSHESVFILIIIVYYTFLYTIFASWPRYSIPLRPEFYLWSLWSCKTLLDLAREKFRGQKAYENNS